MSRIKEFRISSNTTKPDGHVSRHSLMSQKSDAKYITRFARKRHFKRNLRYGIAFGNFLLIAAVAVFIIHSQRNNSNRNLAGTSLNAAVTSPLDQLSSADIAVHAARLVRMDEAVSVAEKANTVNSQLTIVPSDTKVVAKPQVIATAQKTRRDIQDYVVLPGDSVSLVAAKFNITSDTVRWSNGLTGENIAAGKVLKIAPSNGVIYQVKAGDTPETLAQRFKANRDFIIAFNDAEVTGLPVGEFILIPDGSIQTSSRGSGYSSGFSFGSGPLYSGNGYDYGYCTYYVANKRIAAGNPVPSNLGNASTWKSNAARAGFAVGSTPVPGAVAWQVPRDYYGHVGYVEAVYADGSMLISEMNVVGWNRVSSKIVDAAGMSRYSFIY